MNATSYDMAPEPTLAEFDVPTTVSFSALLPYAALAVTLAAYALNAPARVADLVRNERAPSYSVRTERPRALVATNGNYPVPNAAPFPGRTVQQGALFLTR